ncbi:MAG: hypothetical protein HWN81_09975 [Candidatus Lokiarchaeota archaeon]|nr:hypothetical protein [Candidatus Lokiarchaeota archaeon]
MSVVVAEIRDSWNIGDVVELYGRLYEIIEIDEVNQLAVLESTDDD